MLRYVIAFGRTGNAEEQYILCNIRRRLMASRDIWHEALNQPNLLAAHTLSQTAHASALPLQGHRGIVFGSMFPSVTAGHSAAAGTLKTLSAEHTATILRSRGHSLISDFWGHYVAMIHYPETASIILIRSPVSPLPCLYFQVATVTIFISHVADCLALGLRPLSINWDSITAQVVGGDYLTDETGFNEIRSLSCGHALVCSSSGNRGEVYWDPTALLENRPVRQFKDAVRCMRTTVEHCIHTLASSHDGILVNLSGGLDSSIVLSALTRAPHRPLIVAINYYSRGCGDERRFARSMARAARCALVEYPRNECLDFRRFDDCNFTVQPVLNFSAPDIEARNIAKARELQASAIFDGELGDNIFGSNPSAGALLECLRHYGLGNTFLRAVMNYSLLTRRSIWRTLALAAREYRYVARHPSFSVSEEIRRRNGGNSVSEMMLASSAAEDHFNRMADRFLHPWLRKSRRLAPGSNMLIYGLLVVTSATYHSPFSGADDPPQVSPLISQPVIEVALQNPANLNFEYGQDRALAREAFSDVLPPLILQRGLGKGGPNLWAKDVVERNADFVREYLLDGVLAEKNLVDRRKVESALSAKIAKSTVIVGDIFAKLYIEAWLRKVNTLVSHRVSGDLT